MNKIFKLKEWLTLADAARHLSIMFDEDVSEADVLRLALDAHLKLSVRFVNRTQARRGKIVPPEDAKLIEVPEIFGGKPGEKRIGGIHIREGEILELDSDIVTLAGVWDLPMIGSDRLDVEHEYQNQTDGPAVELTNLEGTFVANLEGTIYQLQAHFSNNEFSKKEDLKTPWDHPDNFYPAGGLPNDSVFVVRTPALQEFAACISEPDKHTRKPLGSRERTTLLVIIAALAEIAKIDISKPSKAATSIEHQTNLMGARVAARTIENHLKRIFEAMESRGQP